jgi:hypothetical protein
MANSLQARINSSLLSQQLSQLDALQLFQQVQTSRISQNIQNLGIPRYMPSLLGQ